MWIGRFWCSYGDAFTLEFSSKLLAEAASEEWAKAFNSKGINNYSFVFQVK